MKIHKHQKITPASVVSGDSIQLLVDNEVVLTEQITEAHTFTEAVIFESEPGEFGADYGLGGVFLEKKAPTGGGR